MKREDMAIGVLWVVGVAITVAASVYGIATALDAAAKIMVAVIGGMAMILVAIVTHALTSIREQRLELQRQKQQNYAALLDRLVPFVRAPKVKGDEFTSIHLYSWVVGSPEVVVQTKIFIDRRTEEGLRHLLLAMRQDVGLGYTNASLSGLIGPLPTPPSPEILEPGTGEPTPTPIVASAPEPTRRIAIEAPVESEPKRRQGWKRLFHWS